MSSGSSDPELISSPAKALSTILVSPGLAEEAFRYLARMVHPSREPVRFDGAAPFEARFAGAEIFLWCDWDNKRIPDILSVAPSLRWIHACTAGVDQLWHPLLDDGHLIITRSPNAAATPVAEWALAAILMCAKRFRWYEEMQSLRRWNPNDAVELLDASVVIVGTGAIGSAIAGLARGLGMRVVGVNRSAKYAPGFDEIVRSSELRRVLGRADFVVLACPLTPETRGLVSSEEFGAMKRTAYLINVARGHVVSEPDLVRAVEEGRIAGAFLDVFEDEPLPSSSSLWTTDGIHVTPHSAWRSTKSHIRAVDDFLHDLPSFESGTLESVALSSPGPSA